jgi:hypothetical protein
MLEGTCLCRAVRWQYRDLPKSATACNCTTCRRYGTLWAYGYEGEDVHFFGPTKAYVRGDEHGGSIGFHFCPDCGAMAYWRGLKADEQGRRRVAVNLRLTEPEPVAGVPIRHFDGLDKWEDRPSDGRCVRDMWF